MERKKKEEKLKMKAEKEARKVSAPYPHIQTSPSLFFSLSRSDSLSRSLAHCGAGVFIVSPPGGAIVCNWPRLLPLQTFSLNAGRARLLCISPIPPSPPTPLLQHVAEWGVVGEGAAVANKKVAHNARWVVFWAVDALFKLSIYCMLNKRRVWKHSWCTSKYPVSSELLIWRNRKFSRSGLPCVHLYIYYWAQAWYDWHDWLPSKNIYAYSLFPNVIIFFFLLNNVKLMMKCNEILPFIVLTRKYPSCHSKVYSKMMFKYKTS